NLINRAFIEIMLEGDANGRGFQYPIPTYSITRDFDWSENENNALLFKMAAKYGTPYFSNYVNSDMAPSDVRSMCCRLRLDLRELRKKSGGFFGSGESTGSVGVVTINMPRIAYLAKDKDDFYKRLDRMMDIAARSLSIKRKVITKLLDEGLYPYTKHYLGTFANHFSTIGLVGMNEVGLNASWLGGDMNDPKTRAFAREVLEHMRNRLSDYQEKYRDLYNLEATPAESTAYRLALHDVKRFPNIKTAGSNNPGFDKTKAPYYTNSSHLPVGSTDDIFEALDAQDELQTLYTSGTVFHAFLGEQLSGWKAAANLVRKIADNYRLPYFTLSPTYSVCRHHGYLNGEEHTCPHCGEATEVYSRITGYYRPVGNWNDGKAQEFIDRREYVIEEDNRSPERHLDKEMAAVSE
ncbi:MAG: ribonucleoside triphosphate reductase, partial [Thermoguttaceae bacterium]|nr:ribonucleoside triphosphate reductase [Thermoguttaceae bacterium]